MDSGHDCGLAHRSRTPLFKYWKNGPFESFFFQEMGNSCWVTIRTSLLESRGGAEEGIPRSRLIRWDLPLIAFYALHAVHHFSINGGVCKFILVRGPRGKIRKLQPHSARALRVPSTGRSVRNSELGGACVLRSRTVANKQTVPSPRGIATNGPSPSILNSGHRFRATAFQSTSTFSGIDSDLAPVVRCAEGSRKSSAPPLELDARSAGLRRSVSDSLSRCWDDFTFGQPPEVGDTGPR